MSGRDLLISQFVTVDQESGESSIHSACAAGDVPAVESCVQATTHPESLVNKYHEGLTPLHEAVLSGSAHACDVIRVLIENGGDVNAQSLGEENTGLHLVVEKGVFPRDFPIVVLLLEKGASLSVRNKKLRTAYDCAMGLGHYEVAAVLNGSVAQSQVWSVYREKIGLRYGPSITEAVLNSNLQMLEKAISLGGNPNIINKHGAGAIHYAVTHCSLPVMHVLKKLLDAGADVNLRDDEGDNVLNLAIKSKQLWETDHLIQVVTFLCDCGADPSFKDLDGKDAFDLAEERGYQDVLDILRGPQISPRPVEEVIMEPIPEEEPENYVSTPEQEPEVESEAEEEPPPARQPSPDVNAPNAEGLYPIHVAVLKDTEQERAEGVEVIIQQGARVNQIIEKTGDTALHLCAIRNQADTAEQLLRHHIDYNLKNKEGKTAYDLAKDRNYRGVMAAIEAKRTEAISSQKEKSGSCDIL